MTNPLWEGRGSPWEFDSGPPLNRSWGRLFAETPNYRGLGVAATDREAFRWHFGPMFYRGRLSDNAVKVLIIGQEGAQDESLAERSFTGGTGARMQFVLNHLGITRSYLFLNTFVYPIFGEYTDSLRPLAQHPESPILRHRHEILDYVLARNDLRLVIAVGTAAKESVVSWVRSHGGTCSGSRSDVTKCDPSVLGPRVRLIGVLHPGGATGGALAEIVADFRRAIKQIEEWVDDDPNWLPVDPGGTRLPADDYEYRSAPIPFRDFPYGISWRLGRGATSSNRSNDQRSIQLFGAGGSYNGGDDVLTYPSNALGTDEGYSDDDGDLPYEPPRDSWREFDKGPTAEFARLLMGGTTGFEWPDFSSLGAPGDGSLGLGGMYRGRFQNVKVLVWADQQSQDDLFCCRALCGDAGQHFQGFLDAIGITRDYLILRVLPVDTLGLSWSTDRAMIDNAQTRALHTQLLARIRLRNPGLRVALAMGPQARRLIDHLPTDTLSVVELKAWSESGARTDWQAALARLSDLDFDTDSEATFDWDGERRQIPRIDLPYGSVRWRGTSGDRGVGALKDGEPTPHYVSLFMPEWAYRLPPASLSASDQAAIDKID